MAAKARNAWWPEHADRMKPGPWLRTADYLDGAFKSCWGDVEIVDDPVLRPGLVAFRATVTKRGDSMTPSSKHSEGTDWTGVDVEYDGDHDYQAEGSEGWYGGSFIYPGSSPWPAGWVIPMQMHGNVGSSSPVVALAIEGQRLLLYRRGAGHSGKLVAVPAMRKDTRFDYRFFARWSRTDGRARTDFEVRQDGGSWRLVSSDTKPNMFAASGGRAARPYVQAGCYASAGNQDGEFAVIHLAVAQRFESRELLEQTVWGAPIPPDEKPPPPPPPDPVPPPSTDPCAAIKAELSAKDTELAAALIGKGVAESERDAALARLAAIRSDVASETQRHGAAIAQALED